MSIKLEFINVIVPISVINEKYSGGITQCLKDYSDLIGMKVWCDTNFFRDGAMSPHDAECLVDNWSKLGFTTCEIKDGEAIKWIDVCVVDELWGPTLDCDWIVMNRETRSAYLKDSNPGELYGRNKPLPLIFSNNF